jgi:DNA-binding beta-propeller fold protein YncE
MPWFLAFDGQNIWVTNEGEATISELRASDGTLIGKYSDKLGAAGIAFDGTYMWVTSFASPAVTRYGPDGKEAGTFKVGLGPLNMAFDGANMWVANSKDLTVTELRASDGKVLGTFNTGNAEGPYGIAFDGQKLWISGGTYIVEMRPNDGKLLLQEELTGGLGSVGFDGANIWVAGYAANVAYKL